MKILRVIASMNPEAGGPCQGIRNSIPAMDALGIYNEVVSFDAPNAAFLGKDSFTINAIGPAKGPYRYCENLSGWLQENLSRFDAVIIHGLWLYNGYGTFKAWQKFKKNNGGKAPAIFIMPHGMLDPYFQKAKERRVKAIRNLFFWHFIEKKIVNNVTGVLFTCQEELTLARETFSGYHPKNELNVGYGITEPPKQIKIDESEFFNRFPAIRKNNYMLFLSRVHEKKGVDLLIKGYINLSKNNPDLVPLVIAGPGIEKEYGKYLQQLVSDAGLENKITFTGMLGGAQKWAAIYNSIFFILPSHQENFGIAVVEALACGRPVLITNKVNIWREIEEGNGGLVGDDTQEGTEALLEQWFSLTEDQKTLMYTNAYNVYNKHFASNEVAKNMISTIKKYL
ncbi:glycosyltransferase [Flavobacterium sp. RHBU_24]|uniref:glycosyltransferase n=1 Tax=Flavobacterium sp. RHBU_24 TaxID=3391185 RepID=UPI0039848EB0